jgi:hypothetical protein
MQAGFRMPVGNQQCEMAAEQGESARITSGSNDSRHSVNKRGPMYF